MMKRIIALFSMAVLLLSACNGPVESVLDEPVVFLPDGAVMLHDTEFGIYYGDRHQDGTGVLSLVLSNAHCYRDELAKPYMDSEGDMLVLSLRTPLFDKDDVLEIPAGDYQVSAEAALNTVDASASYVTRLEGTMQSRWTLESGSVKVEHSDKGGYSITSSLVIAKDDQKDTMEYVCVSAIKIADYMDVAPGMISLEDDIIDMPFANVECIYNGDLFGNGTGNFLVNMITKGFVNEDAEVMDVPGVYITLNFFSRLYSGNSDPVLEEGRYIVSTATSSETLFQRWSLLPGIMMETTPFGTYVLQQDSKGEGTMEFVTSGMVDVVYDKEDAPGAGKMCTITYDLTTSGRKISGVWRGLLVVDNQAASTSSDSYLTTLDHDVECDMSKSTGGTLRRIETLHRENVEEQWDYDIAEAWQLYLAPRDWTSVEKDIPWVDTDGNMYDKNNNGIRDRLEAWCADGDVMVLEFVLPLGSQGVIAPELGKTYTYTMQPNLALEDPNYELYVSRMGRPVDEIFDSYYAEQFKGWAEGIGVTSYDRCNARRGFTWAEDGFRGNWYMHYETGQHQILDEHAPAVNGWVKVTRTADELYDFEWEFFDDNPGTHNQISGSIKDCLVKISLN